MEDNEKKQRTIYMGDAVFEKLRELAERHSEGVISRELRRMVERDHAELKAEQMQAQP